MFNPFKSALQLAGVISNRGTLDDTEQDSAYASADNQLFIERKPEFDSDNFKKGSDEAVGGFDGINENDEEGSEGSDNRTSAYYIAVSGSVYSQDEPKDEKMEDAPPVADKEDSNAANSKDADSKDAESKEEESKEEESKEEESKEEESKAEEFNGIELKDADSKDVTNPDLNEETSMDTSLLEQPSPGKLERRACRAARFNPDPVTPIPQTTTTNEPTSSQETYGWDGEPPEEELREMFNIAAGRPPSWAPDDDLCGLNAPSPTPSELKRGAARLATSPAKSVDDTSSDSTGDEFSLRPRNKPPKPKPAPVPFDYNYRPTREQELARANLVEETPAEELYFSHPNPLTLRHPTWLSWSDDPTLSDLEKNIRRTIHSFECYYDLPEDQTIPEWMKKIIRDIAEWSSGDKPGLSPKKATYYSGNISEPWSSSTGTIPASELGQPANVQPGEFYWKRPSDLYPILFQVGPIDSRPKVLRVTNPGRPQTPSDKPQPPSPQDPKGERKATSPKQRSRVKKGKASSSPGDTKDGTADGKPIPNEAIRNWPPKRDPKHVVKPVNTTTLAPTAQRNKQDAGLNGWDFFLFFLGLASFTYAYQCNVWVSAGIGGYMNGGHHGWSTLLTFVSLLHILCLMFPCLYFGHRLAYTFE